MSILNHLSLLLLLVVSCYSNKDFDYTFFESPAQWMQITNVSLTSIIENESCRDHIYAYDAALRRTELWAVQMFDSSTKIHTGVLSGHTVHYGNFEQCLQVHSKKEEYGVIRGQHCTVSMDVGLKDYLASFLRLLYVPKETNIKEQHTEIYEDKVANKTIDEKLRKMSQLVFGICLPDSCVKNDARTFINIFYRNLNISVKRSYDPDLYCYKHEDSKFSTGDKVCIYIFCFVGLLMTFSTGYDMLMMYLIKENEAYSIFVIFSIWTNGKCLFDTTSADITERKVIPSVHGIRALSMITIFVIHKLQSQGYVHNSVMGFMHPVDTFFVLSGLLLYHSTDAHTFSHLCSIPRFYLHRYLRLTPAFAAIILFKLTLLLQVGIGPLWKVVTFSGNCDTYWLSALLHVQNYVNPIFECIRGSWFISADMQLFVLSPLVLIPLRKWHKVGFFGIMGLILIAVGIRIVFQSINSDGKYDSMLYYSTHARFAPFLLGILLGFVIQHGPDKLNQICLVVFWAFSISILIYIQFFMTFFAPFTRILWSASICWIIYNCHKGYGGPVNYILARPFWQPVSRLSYCMYLVYYPLQEMIIGSQKDAEYLNFSQTVCYIWGELAAIFLMAVVWSLAFEIPILNAEKLFNNYLQLLNSNKEEKTEKEVARRSEDKGFFEVKI